MNGLHKINHLESSIVDSFSVEEKIHFFDDIADMFFVKNFGTVSKVDLETYIFSAYIEHLLDEYLAISVCILSITRGVVC